MPRPLRAFRKVTNFLTGGVYDFVPAADVRADAASLARIVSICNEPDVYDWLFRPSLGGVPYGEGKAVQWLDWAKDGWRAGTHFVFAVLDAAGLVAAACDIKSADARAEIGYWCSVRHRGVMTNTVTALCGLAAEAGFHGLFARTKVGNTRSKGVLLRSGFARAPSDDPRYDRFELIMRDRNEGSNPRLEKSAGMPPFAAGKSTAVERHRSDGSPT
jgi:RimJ/RimL family protein N-acetyltransferase